MNNTQRITALENRFDSLEAKLDTLLAAVVEPKAPAKVTRPKAAPKAKARKAQPKAVRCLTRKNRLSFVADAPWAQGLSTQVIAAMCTEDPSLVPAGWAIGERYTQMFA